LNTIALGQKISRAGPVYISSSSTELVCLVPNHLPPLMPRILSSPSLKVLLYLMTPSISKLLALLVYLVLSSLSIHELVYLWSLDNC